MQCLQHGCFHCLSRGTGQREEGVGHSCCVLEQGRGAVRTPPHLAAGWNTGEGAGCAPGQRRVTLQVHLGCGAGPLRQQPGQGGVETPVSTAAGAVLGLCYPLLSALSLPRTDAVHCSGSPGELPASCSCSCSAPWLLPGRPCPTAAGRRPAPAVSTTSCTAWATTPLASSRWARGRASPWPSRAGSTACSMAPATTLRASSQWASAGSTLAPPATTRWAALRARTPSRQRYREVLTAALPAPGSARDTQGRT